MSQFHDPQHGAQPPFGPPDYRLPGDRAAYGTPAPPPWDHRPNAWPQGPARPGPATAAGVLGYVTAGLTILFSLLFLIAMLLGAGDGTTAVLLLGLPCALGLIVGANQLLRRKSERNLFACAGLSIGVLALSLLVGVATLQPSDLVVQAVFLVLALPLPLLTAIFARNRSVTDWVAARDR